MENISEHVRREREARGVTIEELAKGTFISVAVLKDIESGKFDKYFTFMPLALCDGTTAQLQICSSERNVPLLPVGWR